MHRFLAPAIKAGLLDRFRSHHRIKNPAGPEYPWRRPDRRHTKSPPLRPAPSAAALAFIRAERHLPALYPLPLSLLPCCRRPHQVLLMIVPSLCCAPPAAPCVVASERRRRPHSARPSHFSPRFPELIQAVTAEANELCRQQNRDTIKPEDIVTAVEVCAWPASPRTAPASTAPAPNPSHVPLLPFPAARAAALP